MFVRSWLCCEGTAEEDEDEDDVALRENGWALGFNPDPDPDPALIGVFRGAPAFGAGVFAAVVVAGELVGPPFPPGPALPTTAD